MIVMYGEILEISEGGKDIASHFVSSTGSEN